MDNLDFLDGQSPEPADAPTPELTDGPARGPDGKFVSTAPEPEPAAQSAPVAEAAPAPSEPAIVAPPVETPPPSAPPAGYVPIGVVQELRNEIRALKSPPPPPPEAPDPYEDPEGFAGFQQQQIQQVVLNTKLDISEDMARQRHGEEAVDTARDWALARMEASPSFRDEVLSNRNPYEFVVQAYQRDQIVSQLKPTDIEAFRAWQAANAAPSAPQQPSPAAAPPPVPTPPRSLASAPSAGSAKPGEQPVGPGVAFDAVFGR